MRRSNHLSYGSHHVEVLATILSDVVVGARNIHVLGLMGRRCKNKSLIIEAITCHTTIR